MVPANIQVKLALCLGRGGGYWFWLHGTVTDSGDVRRFLGGGTGLARRTNPASFTSTTNWVSTQKTCLIVNQNIVGYVQVCAFFSKSTETYGIEEA